MSFRLTPPEHQLADEFRRRIRTGEWREHVPGILRLAKDFGVTRPLVEKAIGHLIESGEVIHHGVGKPMTPVRASGAPVRRGTLIAHDQPVDIVSGETMGILSDLLTAAPQPASLLRLDRGLAPDDMVGALAATDAEYLILTALPGEVADRLAESGRKVIGLGGSGVSRHTPRITSDYREMICGAFRRCFAAGHTRVSMPLWRRPADTSASIRNWIAATYAEAGLRHAPEFDAPIVPDDSPAAMHACLRELFRLTPPTALVLHDLPHWIAAVSMLNRLRRRIPEDVSVVLITGWTELESATPSVAHMRMDTPSFLPALRRLIGDLDSGAAPRTISLPPRWVPGDSLAPPPAR